VGGVSDSRAAEPAQQGRLAEDLREGTLALHSEAESSGFVLDLIRGRATHASYVLYLRNLYAVYSALESGIERCEQVPATRALLRPEIYRTQSIASDLTGLVGATWKSDLPILPAGQRYAARIESAARKSDLLLVAHAYVRHLGDLSGGQILKRLLATRLGLKSCSLAFYDFAGISDRGSYLSDYRRALNSVAAAGIRRTEIIDEARIAFQLNIDLSRAVPICARPQRIAIQSIR
jgi:heme oxygenase (biliverdin-producing, ferredoxin)